MPQNHLRFGNGFSVALRIGSSKVTGGICKLTAVRRPSKRAAQAGEKPGGQTKWITKDSTDAIASNRERSSMQSLAPERLAARLNAVLSERFIDRFSDDPQCQSNAEEVSARYQPGDTPWRVQEWDDAVAPRTPSWVVHRSDDTEVYRDEERRRARRSAWPFAKLKSRASGASGACARTAYPCPLLRIAG